MGDGLVLESGTHSELLANENGAYARLVNAQRLREAREKQATSGNNDDESTAAGSHEDQKAEEEDIEKQAEQEIPLGRSNTGRSLASEIIEQKKQEQGVPKESKYGLLYLFRRMGRINREAWRLYAMGAVAAVCAYIFVFILISAKG